VALSTNTCGSSDAAHADIAASSPPIPIIAIARVIGTPRVTWAHFGGYRVPATKTRTPLIRIATSEPLPIFSVVALLSS